MFNQTLIRPVAWIFSTPFYPFVYFGSSRVSYCRYLRWVSRNSLVVARCLVPTRKLNKIRFIGLADFIPPPVFSWKPVEDVGGSGLIRWYVTFEPVAEFQIPFEKLSQR